MTPQSSDREWLEWAGQVDTAVDWLAREKVGQAGGREGKGEGRSRRWSRSRKGL